jgi:phosphatidylglycerol lysyltransferase
VAAAYLVAGLRRRQALSVAGWRLELPSPGICLGQLACGCLDWVLAAAALYVVLPPEAGFGFAGFLGIYFLAQVAGLFSQVPGGLGVFETTVLLLAPGLPAPALLASLLIFRASYYLLPLAVAALLLAFHELRRSRQEPRRPR